MKHPIHRTVWRTSCWLVLAHLACAGYAAPEKAEIHQVQPLRKGLSSLGYVVKSAFPCLQSQDEKQKRAQRRAVEKEAKKAKKMEAKLKRVGKIMATVDRDYLEAHAELLGKTYPKVGPGNTLQKAITATVRNTIGDTTQPAGQESIPLAVRREIGLVNTVAPASSTLEAEIKNVQTLMGAGTTPTGILQLLIADTGALTNRVTTGNLSEAITVLREDLNIGDSSPMSVEEGIFALKQQLENALTVAQQKTTQYNTLVADVTAQIQRLVVVPSQGPVPSLQGAISLLVDQLEDPNLAVRPVQQALTNIMNVMGFEATSALESQTLALRDWVAIPFNRTTVYFPDDQGNMVPYSLTTPPSGTVVQALEDTMNRCNPAHWQDGNGNPLPDEVNIMMTGFFKDAFNPSSLQTFGQAVGNGAIKPSHSFPTPTSTQWSFV